jgi:hypothetical protein
MALCVRLHLAAGRPIEDFQLLSPMHVGIGDRNLFEFARSVADHEHVGRSIANRPHAYEVAGRRVAHRLAADDRRVVDAARIREDMGDVEPAARGIPPRRGCLLITV